MRHLCEGCLTPLSRAAVLPASGGQTPCRAGTFSRVLEPPYSRLALNVILRRWLLGATCRRQERPQLTEGWRQASEHENNANRRDPATDDRHDWPQELRGDTRLQATQLVRGAGKDAFDGGDTPPHHIGRGSQCEDIADHHADGVQSPEDAEAEQREPENT